MNNIETYQQINSMSSNPLNPSNPYNFLDDVEKAEVDQYVQYVKESAKRSNHLIKHYIDQPIPDALVKRSRNILSKPLVLAAIHYQLTLISNEEDLSPTKVLKEHMNIATSNMADYIILKEEIYERDGVEEKIIIPTISIDHCTREQLAAIKKLKTTKGIFGITTELELHAKQSSLDALGKMMGIDEADNGTYKKYVEAPEHTRPMLETSSDEEVEKAYINLLESISE